MAALDFAAGGMKTGAISADGAGANCDGKP
jgi:hypothetical protein